MKAWTLPVKGLSSGSVEIYEHFGRALYCFGDGAMSSLFVELLCLQDLLNLFL